jgi:hypothetical protein
MFLGAQRVSVPRKRYPQNQQKGQETTHRLNGQVYRRSPGIAVLTLIAKREHGEP